MFDYKHYVPILKGRQGEYGALGALSPEVKNSLTPLIEIPPIPWDWAEEKPFKSLDTHLQKVGMHFDQCWASDRPFYVDLLWISEDDRMQDGEHPVEFVIRSAREWNLAAIPVISLIRGNDFVEACRRIQEQDKRGICVRIQREDFTEFGNIETHILEFLERLSVTPKTTDLVLDLRSIVASQEITVNSVVNMIHVIPKPREWRSFAVTATSFPENLMGLPPQEGSPIERAEWKLWIEILSHLRDFPRRLTYGDYAISHPESPEVDPRIMRASASIRYTGEESWLVLKGKNLRDNGFKQFHEVCRLLIGRPEYSGNDFSWGDRYIYECAHEKTGPGNLTTWRKVGTSHHLTFAVRQLATLYGS